MAGVRWLGASTPAMAAMFAVMVGCPSEPPTLPGATLTATTGGADDGGTPATAEGTAEGTGVAPTGGPSTGDGATSGGPQGGCGPPMTLCHQLLGTFNPGLGELAAMALGDMDLDGNLDIVVVTNNPDGAAILFGNGDGGFGAQEAYSLENAGAPQAMDLDDLDGDSIPDLLVADDANARLYRLDVGGFVHQQSIGFGFGGVTGIAAADFDADGNRDLIVVANGGDIEVHTGIGRPYLFEFGYSAGYPPNIVGVHVGRLDADQLDDVTFPHEAGGTTSFLRATADGTFLGAQEVGLVAPVAAPIGDLDGDGLGDVAIVQRNALALDVFFGGDDPPTTVIPPLNLPAPGGLSDGAIGDIDLDGAADVAVVSSTQGQIGVFLGDGAGALTPFVLIGVGNEMSDIALGDVNGDGLLDLVTTSRTSGEISVVVSTPGA